MTSDAKPQDSKAKKFALQWVGGGAFGLLGTMAFIGLMPDKQLAHDELILGLVGLIYALTGLSVLLGSLMPKLGAKMLNVSDGEELMEQRKMFLGSSVVMLVWGVAQIILMLSASANALPAWAGVGAMAIALLLCFLTWYRDRHLYDELMWKVTMDASYICFAGLWIVLSLWCAMAMVGLSAAPTPAAILALFSGGYLLAAFVAAGRMGMLAAR